MMKPLLFALTLALPLAAQNNSGPAPKGPALTADSIQHPGVPVGKLSEKLTHVSRIYDGMVSNYWIYVPAQYDPKVPAALMVFQDGSGYAKHDGDHPALNVLDNLIAQHKIPVMIAIFTDPGEIAATPDTPTYRFVDAYGKKWQRTLKDSMRSTEYDTVSDRYPRFLRDELIPEVAKQYNLRKDAYSHAITGLSSGGICSFNAGWQQPEEFSRVITWIGSFTSIQWHEDPNVPDGGQDYPEKVLHEAHRNLRVWVQDGSNDQENPKYGSWPLANIRMANALKLKGYDFHFSFGEGPHSAVEGAAEFPEEMTWLWRDYDPAKTEQTYTQVPAEASKPPFRVAIANREGRIVPARLGDDSRVTLRDEIAAGRQGWSGLEVAASVGVGALAAVGVLAYGIAAPSAQVFGASIFHGDRSRRAIALTFDDGPSPGTLRLLEVLDRHEVPATFFQCGANVLRHPEIARAVVAAGHEVGNHTFSHARLCPRIGWKMNLRSPGNVYQEFATAQAAIVDVTGVDVRYLRAPYGLRWFGVDAVQRRLNLLGVMWTVIGHDWEWAADRVTDLVVRRASPGGIVCLHDGRDIQVNPDISETVAAVGKIIPILKDQGYRFETVSGVRAPSRESR